MGLFTNAQKLLFASRGGQQLFKSFLAGITSLTGSSVVFNSFELLFRAAEPLVSTAEQREQRLIGSFLLKIHRKLSGARRSVGPGGCLDLFCSSGKGI